VKAPASGGRALSGHRLVTLMRSIGNRSPVGHRLAAGLLNEMRPMWHGRGQLLYKWQLDLSSHFTTVHVMTDQPTTSLNMHQHIHMYAQKHADK